MTGVYAIQNTTNGKCYIGSAAQRFEKRWNLHRWHLRHGTHHSPHLQASWAKYGEDSFVFGIIEECAPERCVEREQHWIDELTPEYNVASIAGLRGRLGLTLSGEHRQKISVALKGKSKPPRTADHCDAIGKANLGRLVWNKGLTKATSVKLHGGRPKGGVPWNKGKKASPEACRNQSLGHLKRRTHA